MIGYVVAIVAIGFAFDFINGFHDSANSIATIVGTRVLNPLAAVLWAAVFNFTAVFVVGTGVASTIGGGMIDTHIVTPSVILGALLGAIAWNLITWFFGLPSSSSHALIGGYAGAAVAKAGFHAIVWGEKWVLTLSFIVLSPLIGVVLGASLMSVVAWTFRGVNAGRANRYFVHAQLVSSAFFSFSHGANDAQKTMGIITGLLVASQPLFVGKTGALGYFHVTSMHTIPHWIILTAYTCISFGTLFGGWRIVHTMGSRVTRLRPVGGFCAETAGALSILLATWLAIPVSTTHTISGSIVGVGASHRLSAVRWGVASRIVWAWILTIPAAAIMAALSYILLRSLIAP